MRKALALVLLLAGCGGDPPTVDGGGVLDAAAPDEGVDAGQVDADARGPVCDPRAPACADGTKCTATRWALDSPWPTPRCTPVPEAPSDPGGACFSADGVFDNCDAEHACTNYGTGEGFCVRLCREPGTPCGGTPLDAACATVDPVSGFALCLPRCVVDDDCPSPVYMRCEARDGLRLCVAAREAP